MLVRILKSCLLLLAVSKANPCLSDTGRYPVTSQLRLGDVHEDGEGEDDVDLDLLFDEYNNYENSISRAVCGITSTP